MEQAVPPLAPIFKAYNVLRKVKSAIEESTDNESSIAGIELDPRWKTICEVIQGRIDALSRMDGMIDDTDTVETVGFRFLAARIAIAQLSDILSLPATLQAAEKINGQRTKTGKSNTQSR